MGLIAMSIEKEIYQHPVYKYSGKQASPELLASANEAGAAYGITFSDQSGHAVATLASKSSRSKDPIKLVHDLVRQFFSVAEKRVGGLNYSESTIDELKQWHEAEQEPAKKKAVAAEIAGALLTAIERDGAEYISIKDANKKYGAELQKYKISPKDLDAELEKLYARKEALEKFAEQAKAGELVVYRSRPEIPVLSASEHIRRERLEEIRTNKNKLTAGKSPLFFLDEVDGAKGESPVVFTEPERQALGHEGKTTKIERDIQYSATIINPQVDKQVLEDMMTIGTNGHTFKISPGKLAETPDLILVTQLLSVSASEQIRQISSIIDTAESLKSNDKRINDLERDISQKAEQGREFVKCVELNNRSDKDGHLLGFFNRIADVVQKNDQSFYADYPKQIGEAMQNIQQVRKHMLAAAGSRSSLKNAINEYCDNALLAVGIPAREEKLFATVNINYRAADAHLGEMVTPNRSRAEEGSYVQRANSGSARNHIWNGVLLAKEILSFRQECPVATQEYAERTEKLLSQQQRSGRA